MNELSFGADLAWRIAAGEAVATNYPYIEKEHMFVGICSIEKALLFQVEEAGFNPRARQALEVETEALREALGGFELDLTQLRRRVREKLRGGDHVHTERVVHRSTACKMVFKRAHELVASLKQVQNTVTPREISCLHLLAAILEEPGEIIGDVLDQAGMRPADLRKRVLTYGGRKQKSSEERESVKVHEGAQKTTRNDTEYLDRYGRDLTQEAREDKLGPFIGRREELLQAIQTLARRSKNNPVLVGEAGVGKTAIVEALAIRIAQGKDPHILTGRRVIELNMGTLLAGTKYRGEFEERLAHILEEVRAHPEVIVFIDEIHNVVGAGRVEGGSIDAANLLKPALTRGDFRCIGATTLSEYRRYIESDPALERRFEKIVVNEPNRDTTLEMLKGIRPKWEEHHRVRISDRALEAAVDLSIRFDTDHHLPDKAIDLVDKAGARARIPVLSMKPQVMGGNLKLEGNFIGSGPEATELTIAQVLSEKIGVPLEIIVGHLEGMSQSRLLELEPFLRKQIIGQDEAVERICQRLIMTHAGLGKRRGPLAVFLFLGPTGVGKTHLARVLARFLFGGESDMIRLDMSEYIEEHSVSKLIGSPPGYVGHEEEGQLTGKLRTKPYSVVLLDEVEKAHPRVFDLFLQVFDEGRLTDSKGRTIDARNAIFVMTSNLGSNLVANKPIGFREQGEKASIALLKTMVLDEVKKRFRSELINRIDEQVVFQPLDEENVRKILKLILDEISTA
ncbi:MAG: ATP-dependent Clp protease ATP-binding subunit, partial [Nitrospira sp.]|nr:ATP-dependent Clp protease ATP-binding subunit [Nitrospira sp.]